MVWGPCFKIQVLPYLGVARPTDQEMTAVAKIVVILTVPEGGTHHPMRDTG